MTDGYRRHAIYFMPDGELGRFGAAWLGWDAIQGRAVPHPEVDLPVQELTRTPRRYGFHATLRAPSRLAENVDSRQLSDAAARLAAELAPVDLPGGLQIAALGDFLALVPTRQTEALTDLAARLVEGLDRFRAPPSDEELARREASGLTTRQRELLHRWGYPYVMEQFRFHITLTGALPASRRDEVRKILEPLVGPMLTDPFRIGAVALMGEDSDGMFHQISHLPLGAQTGG